MYLLLEFKGAKSKFKEPEAFYVRFGCFWFLLLVLLLSFPPICLCFFVCVPITLKHPACNWNGFVSPEHVFVNFTKYPGLQQRSRILHSPEDYSSGTSAQLIADQWCWQWCIWLASDRLTPSLYPSWSWKAKISQEKYLQSEFLWWESKRNVSDSPQRLCTEKQLWSIRCTIWLMATTWQLYAAEEEQHMQYGKFSWWRSFIPSLQVFILSVFSSVNHKGFPWLFLCTHF